MLRELARHLHQVPGHGALAANLQHAAEVIDFLKGREGSRRGSKRSRRVGGGEANPGFPTRPAASQRAGARARRDSGRRRRGEETEQKRASVSVSVLMC
jgi:hypothetical protein